MTEIVSIIISASVIRQNVTSLFICEFVTDSRIRNLIGGRGTRVPQHKTKCWSQHLNSSRANVTKTSKVAIKSQRQGVDLSLK
jgi:hypothetical protein